jgi:hypothetical protein
MISSRRAKVVLLPLALLLTLLLQGTAFGKNLVDNPEFRKAGEDPVPDWTVRRVAGLTEFKVEEQGLVATRRRGSTGASDTCLQMLYLPDATRAIRIEARVSAEKLIGAEFNLRFVQRDGGPGGHRKVFPFAGTHPERLFTKDLLLPEGTKDVEIAIRMRDTGKLTVRSVAVERIDPAEVRGEARFVTVRGRFFLTPAGAEAVPTAVFSLPVPPPSDTQCPVSLTVRAEPASVLRSVKARREDGLDRIDLVVGPLEPEYKVIIEWEARVFLTDLESQRDLPQSIEIVPSRHLSRRISAFADPPHDAALKRLAERAIRGSTDLRVIAERVADLVSREIPMVRDGPSAPEEVAATKGACSAGWANLATALFRLADVPAQPVTLLSADDGFHLERGVLAFHKEYGWLLFSLDPRAPRPVPRSSAVLVARGPLHGWVVPESPSAELGVTAGFESLGYGAEAAPFAVRGVGAITLPSGAAADLISALTKSWSRACRVFDPDLGFRVDPARVVLSGRAKNLKQSLTELMGDER